MTGQDPSLAPNLFSAIIGGFIDLLFPPVCLICDTSLPDELADGGLCSGCREQLQSDSGECCRFCAGTIGPHTENSQDCLRCRGHDFRFDRAVRLGRYEGLLRDVILSMKHQSKECLAERLGQFWAAQRRTEFMALKCDLIVPVPLHWLRRLHRGYNQAEALARGLARELHLPIRTGILWRKKATPPQYQQTPTGRREQMKGAFVARLPRSSNGSRILLVDDVLTTGSTCSEAARALKAAGAGEVVAAVLARADNRPSNAVFKEK